jgi:hypothetical protein
VLRHSGSISAEHLVDVVSANPQIVKSWLTAKLDFSPPVVIGRQKRNNYRSALISPEDTMSAPGATQSATIFSFRS